METTDRTVSRRQIRQQIERWRNNVLDCEIRVDDDRRDVDAAVRRLQASVRERDAAQHHLAHLIELRAEAQGIAATFGPEIAETFLAPLEARG